MAKKNLNKELGIEYTNNVLQIPGGLLLMSYDVLMVLDDKLNKVKEKRNENGQGFDFGNIYQLRDGSYVVMKWGETGQEYTRFNPQTLELGDKLDTWLSKNYNYSVLQGHGYDFFLRDSTQIYGYNVGDTDPTPLMNFINSDIYTSYFNAFDSLDERTFVGSYQEWDKEKNIFHLCKYNKVNPEDVKDKEIISLGCLYVNDSVRKMVVDFNRSSEEYRINLVDYSVYNTEDDWMAGDNKFNTDIVTGQGPDIIIGSETQRTAEFISKGLLEDLGKYLDNDADLSRESILPGILEATSNKGKVYQLIPSFRIVTAVGKKAIIGNRDGWNMSEMLDYAKTLPEGMKLFHDMTRESFLDYLFRVSIEDYINPETGKCNFDSENFMKVLEYIKTLPKSDDYYSTLYNEDFNWAEYEYEVRNGKAALNVGRIYEVRAYKNILRGEIGEEPVFVGFPSEDRKGSYYEPDMSIGISSRCKHPDAAWQFIRQFMLPDYQTNRVYGMPGTVAAFDATCEEAKENPYWTDENGNKQYYDDTIWINGVDIPSPPLTDAEIAVFKDFVNSVQKLEQGFNDVSNIIFEEAAPYFEGQKSVEEVVKIIQSRASIFVNEQQ